MSTRLLFHLSMGALIFCAGALAQTAPTGAPRSRTVGIVLFPGFEVLDVYGPIEFWAYVPDFKIVTVAQQAGPVKSRQGLATIAEYSFATAPHLDIVMVPGGMGTRTEVQNPEMLKFLRDQNEHTELTTSVCTGSAVLAKAGLLDGKRATSNKEAFSFAMAQSPKVRWIPNARWVEDGKFITSSGVSAGMDMALGLVAKLYGKDRAVELAKNSEYVWNSDASNDPFAVEMPRPPKTQEVLQLEKATPSAGSVVATMPQNLRLAFTDEIDLSGSTLEIRGPMGALKLTGLHVMDSRSLMATIAGQTPNGVYTVSWSANRREARGQQKGEFSFTLKAIP